MESKGCCERMNKAELKELVWTEQAVDKFDLDVYEIVDELYNLLLTKHHDYGPLNIAQSPGGPLNGLRVRMWDKIARINHLIDNGAEAQNEPLEDSYKDLANYAIIALMVLREKWPTE
jgi:hypothetical protein